MQLVRIESAPVRNSDDIHADAMMVARDLKANYLRMFDVLVEIETRQIYLEFGVPSLFVYCVELLELSRNVATDFINVARKALEVPALADAVRSGKVSISKARKICSVVTEANAKEWIELAIHCSSRVVERAVAMANPKETVQESMKFVSGEGLEFKLGVSEEWSELLTRTKDLLSQKLRRTVSSEEALFILMSEHVRKHDPVAKAERTANRSTYRARSEATKE